MTDTHNSEEPHGPSVQTYLVIFGALCVFTAVSFIVNAIYGIGSGTGMTIIMAVAICKATLVGMFFMHLKFEWLKLYFLMVPVAILGVMMMIVLLPDLVVAWRELPPHEQSSTHK
jgi:cytochrome c oxidase subunit 4